MRCTSDNSQYSRIALVIICFIMSRNKEKIIQALKKRGFTDNEISFKLFYWVKDGWYLHCDQVSHVCIGYNVADVIRQTENGTNDQFLKPRIYPYSNRL